MPADRTRARSRSPGYHRDRQDTSRRDYRHHDDRRDTGNRHKHDYDAPRRDDPPRARQYDKTRHTRSRTRSRSPDRYSAARPAYRPLHDAPAEPKPQTTVAAEKRSKTSREASPGAAGDELELALEADAMAAMMGFAGFGTTKGAHVSGNSAAGAVAKVEKRVEYRQYMNRKGGFNRPLDESSTV